MTSGGVRPTLRGLAETTPDAEKIEENRTDVAILTATASVIGDYGEHNLTIDQVAERAGCSRMTVFRRFGSREQLLTATYSRELRIVLERITEAVAGTTTAVDCAEIVMTQYIDSALRHPVFIRLLRTEPQVVIELSRGGQEFSGQGWGTALFAKLLSDPRLADALPAEEAAFVGDLLMRLVFSLVLVPAPEMDESTQARRRFLRRVVEQALQGRPTGRT